MIIRSMTATFGKLEKAELRLDDGLNILSIPNEGGKSTWAAFILAMFYGIDTSERAAKGSLPVKTRFKPWSGAAMEGRMEICWNGREITLERSSKGRIPMGEFRAYETESGLPVPELTAENVGLTLLGAEKAVFERSAFLRQSGLKVDQTGALEQRLSALVATGEENVSYSDTEKRLRDWRNAVRHNRTGDLPRMEQELERMEETLRQIRENQNRSVELRAREEEKTAAFTKLQRAEQGMRAAEQRRQQELLDQAAADTVLKRERAEKLRLRTAALPDEATLYGWQEEWTALQTARRSISFPHVQMPKAPEITAVFAGKTPDEIEKQVRKDLYDYDAYETAAQPLRIRFPWLALILAAAALCMVMLSQAVVGALCGGAAALMLYVYYRKKCADQRERSNAALAAREILNTYGVDGRDEIVALADRTKTMLNQWEQQCHAAEQARTQQWSMSEELQQKEMQYLDKLRRALEDFDGEPVSALHRALRCRQEAVQADREATEAEQFQRRFAESVKLWKASDESAQTVTDRDAAVVHRQMLAVQSDLAAVRSALDRMQGQIEALGDPAELESERETLSHAIAEKQRHYDALTMAMDALAKANAVLQTQFAPEISRAAAKIMAKLTNGRYNKVMLDHQLSISSREAGAVISRELTALSQGTGDQLYLAVRLAICNAVLPRDVPLVLDDALVNFDDERTAMALDVLQEEAEHRQILLFTCQNREKNQLKKS